MSTQDTQQQKPYKVLLIGDRCVDEYQYGTVDRLSPEAPVPIFKPEHKEVQPGMAGNVLRNLESLGLDVVSYFGNAGTKTRLIDRRSRQHILRIDQDIKADLVDPTEIDFEEFNAIVISDYNKGTLSYESIEKIIQIFHGPVIVDSKKPDLLRFQGAIVKINESEYLARHSVNNNLIVTLGDRGAMWKRYSDEQFYSAKPVEVADVCGAGDTFLAAFTYHYLNKKSIPEAIKFAIKASAVTVRHIGVYAPELEEIK